MSPDRTVSNVRKNIVTRVVEIEKLGESNEHGCNSLGGYMTCAGHEYVEPER
jgi:hypothetical protein